MSRNASPRRVCPPIATLFIAVMMFVVPPYNDVPSLAMIVAPPDPALALLLKVATP